MCLQPVRSQLLKTKYKNLVSYFAPQISTIWGQGYGTKIISLILNIMRGNPYTKYKPYKVKENVADMGNMFMRGLKNYKKNVIGGAKIVGGVAKKGINKLMTPTIKVMKKNDAKMEEMDRKAKAGEFN